MNKKLVRASYESCLNGAARLSAYVTSIPFVDALEVNERQDILAENDLVEFCIHARRLINNAGLEGFVKQLSIKSNDGTNISMWRIIGYLIHHEDIEIIRTETKLKMLKVNLDSKTTEEYWSKISSDLHKKTYSSPISPLILFKSDMIEYTMITMSDFMKLFSEKVIIEVINKAFDHNLCLIDPPFRDLDTEGIPTHLFS